MLKFKTFDVKEWRRIGERLYGKNPLNWKFRCPICDHIQCAEDFRKYKAQGANPNDAYQKCIGRYENGRSAFNCTKKEEKIEKCDYITTGFFNIGHIVVMEDKKQLTVFPFAEEKNENI